MPIGTIESINPLNYKLVYSRADGMPNSLESMVVCESSMCIAAGIPATIGKERLDYELT
jgi:hypothetical protein